jgi:hypothetical protein
MVGRCRFDLAVQTSPSDCNFDDFDRIVEQFANKSSEDLLPLDSYSDAAVTAVTGIDTVKKICKIRISKNLLVSSAICRSQTSVFHKLKQNRYQKSAEQGYSSSIRG